MVDVNNNLNIIDMKENEVVASQNAIENENAVETASNEQEKNEKIMNEKIDFSSVCGEEVVATTATIDQKVVSEMFKAFMAMPSSVVVKFKNDNGYILMTVNLVHKERFFSSYTTYADNKLVEAVIASMNGRIGTLENYQAEERTLTALEVDPRVDLFSQFMESPLRCRFDSDFVAKNGDHYMCATFRVGYKKEVIFCLKRTEEIEEIINNAIQAA